MGEELQGVVEIVRVLTKAQSSLCLLGTSWLAIFAWVFAAEQKKGNAGKRWRALLGVFWLPGLLAYYLLPDMNPNRQTRLSPTLRRPKTTVVKSKSSTPGKPRRGGRQVITYDGVPQDDVSQKKSLARRAHVTDDGASRISDVSQQPVQDPASSTFQLRVLVGARKNTVHQLLPGQVYHIGCAPNNHIRLSEKDGVARWHAVVEWLHGNVILRDAEDDERHSISVNQAPVQIKVKVLHEGDIIQLGRAQLKFERSGA